jgi:hypothetical protein
MEIQRGTHLPGQIPALEKGAVEKVLGYIRLTSEWHPAAITWMRQANAHWQRLDRQLLVGS